MTLSGHAKKRMQHRAIPEEWLWLLYLCGESTPQEGGTEVLHLSKPSAKRLRMLLKQLDHLEDVYLVMADDGNVITTAHRHCRKQNTIRDFSSKNRRFS